MATNTTAPANLETALKNTPAVSMIKRPRLTEKATSLAEGNVYTFDVDQRANKVQIREAIKTLYNVTPKKIAISTIKAKEVFVRGKRGTKSGGKKAMVFLKKGDAITLM